MSDQPEETPVAHEQYEVDEEPAFIGQDDMVEIEDEDGEEPNYDDEDDDEDYDGEEDDDMDEDREPFAVDENLKDKATAVITKHTDAVVSVAISKADPNLIVSGSCDENAYVHRVTENGSVELVATLDAHNDTISAIAFNFDSSLVATASYDATIKIWKTADWSLVQTLEGPADDIEWVDWHPRGNCIIAGSKDATSWMWWATNGNVMQVFTGHGDEVVAGAFGLSGKAVCTASKDGTAIVYNPRTGGSTHTFDKKVRSWHQVPLASLATHSTMPLMATGDLSGEVCISNIESGTILVRLDNHNHSLESISFGPWAHTPAMLLTAALDGTALVRDCSRFDARCTIENKICIADEDGEAKIEEELGVEGITRSKWHPNGLPLFVTAANDATARVFDSRDGTLLQVFTGHKDALLDLDVAVLPTKNGKSFIRIATASDDKTVRVFDYSTTERFH